MAPEGLIECLVEVVTKIDPIDLSFYDNYH